MNENNRQNLRAMVRGAYDLETSRITAGNRLCASYRSKLGIEPGVAEEESPEEAQDILATIRASYKKMTDGIKTALPSLKNFKGNEIISSYTEACLIEEYLGLEKVEETAFKRLDAVLSEFEVYNVFMNPIRGLGPKVSGVLISEIDISKCKYPSSLWKYAGYDTVLDGTAPDGTEIRSGRSRRDEHLVERTYISKDKTPKTRKGLSFNPLLKTKLYVMAEVFIKQGARQYLPEQKVERAEIAAVLKNTKDKVVRKALKEQLVAMQPQGEYGNIYKKVYDEYKSRLEHHKVYGVQNDEARKRAPKKAKVEGKEQEDGYAPGMHRHNMAMRYMIKMLLLDLYKSWRALEGLVVEPPYHEAKLGIFHHSPSDQKAA